MTETVAIFKKDDLTKAVDSKPIVGGETGSLAITGLSAGTVVADGDYVAGIVTNDVLGETMPVPGFTVTSTESAKAPLKAAAK